ncbi:hypothetical protein ABID92_002636 [Frigoribacterium sp. PvP120]|uniref:Ig-like domain-containing protein n=1 Tax=unclassified Frigoribacterium TaxID=2627005 RepID=UPI001AEA293F|nr:Ig-like domain-containing protein [Frigoribacterium sp. PvP121]MBP1240548.1 hypothetical protein [Frigoribacterium sp. PvP121]
MSTIRTGLAAVGLAALAAGTLAPAAALAAPSAGTDDVRASAASQPAAATLDASPVAPRLAFVDQTDDGKLSVAGLAPGAPLAGIIVEGGGTYTAAVWDDRFATLVDLADLGKAATLVSYTPQGRVEVDIVLDVQYADGEDRAPGTPVVHAVSQYDDEHLVVEGTVAHEPGLFAKTEVWASRSGASWDFPSENGAFSLLVPVSRAGETIDVTAYYQGHASESTPVELVPTERNTASDAHPLELASPAQGAVVADPAPTFSGTGIPNSQIVVTRDGETARSTSTLCETRVAVTGDWSCTSAALPAGSHETTVTETPTWASAEQQRAGASFTVDPGLLPGETPATPQLSSVQLDNTGELAVRVIAHNASRLSMTIDGEEVETLERSTHGRFTFSVDPALLGETAVFTGVRSGVESPPLEAPLTLLEAPAGAPLQAPLVHEVAERDDDTFTIYATTSYFPDEFLVPGIIAKVDDTFVSSSANSLNGATFIHVESKHAGEEVDLYTVRGDGLLSPVTTVTLAETEGNTAPEVFPLDVVSPREGETVGADTRTFRGEGIPGSRVLITSDVTRSTTLGAASVLPDGTWTAEIAAPLPSGDQTVTVTETPYWENLDPIVSTRSFVVAEDGDGGEETPAPAAPVTIATPADVTTGYTPNSPFTFTGTAEPGSTLTVTNAKGLSLGTAVEVNDDGEWTWTRSNMGSYTWTMDFTTDAGTDRAQTTRLTGFAPREAQTAPVTIDTPADVATGYAPDTAFTFGGTAEPGAEITVTNAKGLSLGAAVEVNSDGDWTWTRSNMGSYTWTMIFTADAGTDRQQAATLAGFAPRASTIAPVVVTNPADTSTGYTANEAFTFEGTAEPGSTLTVTNAKGLSLGTTVEVNDEGDWTWTRTNMGSYTWTILFTTHADTDDQQQTRLTGFAPRN